MSCNGLKKCACPCCSHAMCLCATIQQVGNQFISDLSNYFDVELINRFSQKYTFSEISRSVYRKIVEKRLASEIKVIKRLRTELNIDSLFSADELAKAVDKITADTYNIKSGARPAITAVSKFIDSKLLSHFSRMAKTYRPNQN